MVFTISLESGDAEGLRSLFTWLNEAPKLRGRVRMAAHADPGTLGSAPGWLEVLLQTGLPATASVLGSAIVVWLRQRTTDIKLTVKRPDGALFELSLKRASGDAKVEELEAAAQKFLREGLEQEARRAVEAGGQNAAPSP